MLNIKPLINDLLFKYPLTILGNLKIFPFPLFLVYDPSEYKITGKQIIEIANIAKPGTIIFRGYDNYLDSYLVPNLSGISKTYNINIGKGFSHGGIITNNNQVIHITSKGIEKTNLIDFCQCDRIALLKPRKYQLKANKIAKYLYKNQNNLQISYDFKFNNNTLTELYCFELVKICYPSLYIEPNEIKKFFGLIKKDVLIA